MSMKESYMNASKKKSSKGKKKSKAPSLKKMEKQEAMQQRGYKGSGGR